MTVALTSMMQNFIREYHITISQNQCITGHKGVST